MGTGDNYTLVGNLSGIEYLNYEDRKFSKSNGIGIFGDQAKVTGLDSDIFRFYLAYIRPESQDAAFAWDDFTTKNNSELLNNLGNFINRALAFCEKNMDATVPPMKLTNEDAKILARINQELKEYDDNLEKIKLRDGIRNILSISRIGNQYMQAKKPWALVKGTDEEKIEGATVIGVCINIAYILSVVIYPYMPNVSFTIRKQLNLESFDRPASDAENIDSTNIRVGNYAYPVFEPKFTCLIKEGHKLGKIEPLFKRILEADAKAWKEQFAGKREETEAELKKKAQKEKKKEKKAAAAAEASVDKTASPQVEAK